MNAQMFSLEHKVALVTGASRGIGEAIALAYAQAGADVALAARSTDALEATAARIRAMGREAVAVTCDVTSTEQVRSCVDNVLKEFGRIDVLVNNAGGPKFNASFLATREEGWDKVIDLNLSSVLRFCQLVGAHMVSRGSGSVINISSVATFRPSPGVAAYAAAKSAVASLTQILAQEWARAGVRVNTVSPGWINTEINRRLMESEVAASRIRGDVPMGRWGETDDLVGVAVWLASAASSYVTGANIPVDGGLAVAGAESWRGLGIERTSRQGRGHAPELPPRLATPREAQTEVAC